MISFRNDAEAEALILWPPDTMNWLTGKDPDVGKDWGKEKRTTEAEMVGWHHQLDGHEFEQALGVGDGQGTLACCSPRGHKESDMTEWLNWPKNITNTIKKRSSSLRDKRVRQDNYESNKRITSKCHKWWKS